MYRKQILIDHMSVTGAGLKCSVSEKTLLTLRPVAEMKDMCRFNQHKHFSVAGALDTETKRPPEGVWTTSSQSPSRDIAAVVSAVSETHCGEGVP